MMRHVKDMVRRLSDKVTPLFRRMKHIRNERKRKIEGYLREASSAGCGKSPGPYIEINYVFVDDGWSLFAGYDSYMPRYPIKDKDKIKKMDTRGKDSKGRWDKGCRRHVNR